MKQKKAVSEETITLNDADIGSRRSVTRRSLLGALGIGAGIATAATFATMAPTAAADSSDADKGKKKTKTTKKPKPESDND